MFALWWIDVINWSNATLMFLNGNGIFESILFDQLVNIPFVSFLAFNAFKGMVNSKTDLDAMEAKKHVSHYWNVSVFDDLQIMCWNLNGLMYCHINEVN